MIFTFILYKSNYLGRIKVYQFNSFYGWMDCIIARQRCTFVVNASSVNHLYETRMVWNHQDYCYFIVVFARPNPECRRRDGNNGNTFNSQFKKTKDKMGINNSVFLKHKESSIWTVLI